MQELNVDVFLFALAAYTMLAFSTEAFFDALTRIATAMRAGAPVDMHLYGRTQLWGVFVYGISSVLSFEIMGMFLPKFFELNWIIRGCVYMIGIYAWEFYWGYVLENLIGYCPWQYKDSPHMVWRYLNPRFFFFWFIFGFALEWIHLVLVPAMAQIL